MTKNAEKTISKIIRPVAGYGVSNRQSREETLLVIYRFDLEIYGSDRPNSRLRGNDSSRTKLAVRMFLDSRLRGNDKMRPWSRQKSKNLSRSCLKIHGFDRRDFLGRGSFACRGQAKQMGRAQAIKTGKLKQDQYKSNRYMPLLQQIAGKNGASSEKFKSPEPIPWLKA